MFHSRGDMTPHCEVPLVAVDHSAAMLLSHRVILGCELILISAADIVSILTLS